MTLRKIALLGHPVLLEPARPVADPEDAEVRALVRDMTETLADSRGLGLAAPQVGVQKRLFVWDLQDDKGPKAIVNPEIVESDGEWVFEEGCLSVPGLSWEITRPNHVHVVGRDLEGNEVSFDASEFEGRMFQHELDHINGVLLVDRLDEDQARQAKRQVRELMLGLGEQRPVSGRLSLR